MRVVFLRTACGFAWTLKMIAPIALFILSGMTVYVLGGTGWLIAGIVCFIAMVPMAVVFLVIYSGWLGIGKLLFLILVWVAAAQVHEGLERIAY
jgi:hypothetical protein